MHGDEGAFEVRGIVRLADRVAGACARLVLAGVLATAPAPATPAATEGPTAAAAAARHDASEPPTSSPSPTSSANEALVKAVAAGDAGGVRAALAAGADPNARDGSADRVPVLVLASDAGADDIVQALLSRGADPNARIPLRTALMAAARNNHARAAKLLLDAGADVSAKAVNADFASGATALHFAAVGGYSEVVRLLLDRGADPTARTDRGASVLKWASLVNDPETNKALNAAVEKRQPAAPCDPRKAPPDVLAQLAAKAVVLRTAEYFWMNPDYGARLSGLVKVTVEGEGGTPVDRLYLVGSEGVHVANLTLRVVGKIRLVPPSGPTPAAGGDVWTAVAPGALAVDAKDATFLVTGSFGSKRAPGCTVWLEGDFRFDARLVFSRDADPVRLAGDARSVEFDEGARLHVGRDTFSWSRAGWKPAR